MYKLVLVDDEEEVRKGIIRKIEWEKYGFEICGEAENGREALDLVEKSLPDILITDIKMPFMDGLMLSEILHERYPTVKIVILTGFDEFEYAQKAIRLNVVEYILKPIASEDIIELLIKMKTQIDEEIARREDINALREQIRKSLPVIKAEFITSLFNSRLSKPEIIEKSKYYGIDLGGRWFLSCILSIDKRNHQDIWGNAFLCPEEKELLKFAVLNITEEIIGKYRLGPLVLHNDDIVILGVHQAANRDYAINKTLSVLEEVRQCIEKFLKTTVTIGVGSLCDDVTLIGSSWQRAVTALDYKLILGNNRIICIDDVEPTSTARLSFDERKAHALERCLKLGIPGEINDMIDEYVLDIAHVKGSFEDYQIYLLEILTTILKVAKDSNIEFNEVFGQNYNLFIELLKFSDLNDVSSWIKNVCMRVMDFIKKGRMDYCKMLVDEARKYVNENYHESDITVNKICSHLHISPAYFSSIFKKETKTTFINYLTQVRMDSAKVLLKSTSLKAFEIAEKVGFADSNYFSYCFKKNFGISPSEYRNSG